MEKNSLVRESIKSVIKKNFSIILLMIFIIFAFVISSLLPPQILRYIIDNNLAPRNNEGLLLLAYLYMGAIFLIGLFDLAKETLLTIIGQKITKEVRMKMMEKLEKINAMFFSKNESGKIVSNFTNDVDAINSMFTSVIIGMIIDCFKIIGVVVSIWLFSVKLGIIAVLLLPIIYYITRFFQKRMLKAQIDNLVSVSKVNNHISESVKNIRMIKLFSKESYMESNYNEYLVDNYETIERVTFYDSIFSPIILVIRSLIIALIVILSSEQLNFLGVSVGMIAASIELISNLFTPIENLGMELQNIQQSISGIYRVNEFYEISEDAKDSVDLTNILGSNNLSLSFNNVTFNYEDDKNVLENIDFKIKPLERITFVGRTGVGKSTLFKLAMGLLKPSKGSITINGINVYNIPNSEKRKIFGYVDQSFPMLSGTVAEQISLKDNSVTFEQVKESLDFVGLTDYIKTLENGYNTEVKKDNLFSQGQKQLLAIARAIVTNPPILLLDEITASLDSITEEKIITVLQKASQNHSILTISHRLSSMISSDKIIILENGKIKNSGTPETLLKSDDWYRNHIELEKLTWN
ncbi:ATP-binding cassette subfamily B protein [Sedimentibacter acidaminivorans]|uniref:ATP-binding cassette subfamily B protein n=1 Tax=Sedimentibacter acidaminivorans TaxID=913099 RepID=A0ABS4GAN6_9FIRM|nr:ABC transporter ATP-binding protein [Sedimentibacter acidaminivorans]MBP1924729.1 ATP-binding cassette subfamily B protein [Sedimentibacter acidaminivorans]